MAPTWSTKDCYDVVIIHLQQQRDTLDRLILFLEQTIEWKKRAQEDAEKNSMVSTNPALHAAAPAGLSSRKFTIGGDDAPKPPDPPSLPEADSPAHSSEADR